MGISGVRLSGRLRAVADFVTQGNRVADVGTDHGYVPVYLVQNGIVPRAVAMDVNEAPLERARANILGAHLQQYIEVRRSDGLCALKPGEADCAVMAGMGGQLVIRILDRAPDVVNAMRELVLEPQSDIALVRRYLREHGMVTDRENLVLDAGNYYPVLHVVPGPVYASEYRDSAAEAGRRERAERLRRSLEERLADADGRRRDPPDGSGLCRHFLDEYGECLLADRHPLLPKLLSRDAERKRRILRELGEHAGGSLEKSREKNPDGAVEAGGNRQEKNRQRQREVGQELAGILALLGLVSE